MKKRLLLLITGIALSVFVAGQSSFTLSHPSGGEIIHGATLAYIGELTTSMLESPVYVTNNTAETKFVLVKKVILQNVENSVNTFCWAEQCYGPDTYVSPNADEIPPGATATDFVGEYSPVNTEGIATIMYVWFDRDDINDSTYVIVHFNTAAEKKLAITDKMGNFIDGNTVTLTAIDESTLDFMDARIINFRYGVVDTKVMKMIESGDTIPGSTNEIYWDKQYSPDVYETDAVSLDTAEVFYGFKGMYNAHDQNGTSTIGYKIFDANDAENSVMVTVVYDIQGLGISNPESIAEVSNPYPNPANNMVNFNVNIKKASHDIKIIIRNLLGAKVKETMLNSNSEQVSINTGDLTEGLYVYSLVIDDRAVSTNKLVVRH